MRHEFQQKTIRVFGTKRSSFRIDDLILVLNKIKKEHGNLSCVAIGKDSNFHLADQILVVEVTSNVLDGTSFITLVNKGEIEKINEENE